ncbi:hypothetical protein [Vibrio sp. 16]|uniref:hypothetical protein n=1 Tax=Vibrio sp. 16 TaxID=391586 RepID=UPI00018F3122|nr:hypothetical protein [Vibrio sp. 16]EED26823.1 conserved hypothetical protein [Vibrio sp. 16]CAK4073930.1 hypothetical protein VDT1_3108 [Vibrio sp. 16]
MKWLSFTSTITAAWLCTLPFHGTAAHCDAKAWDQLVKIQQKIDASYNQHAERFNRLLQYHQQQPFLHQAFSSQELNTLWVTGTPSAKQKFELQMDSSRHLIQAIDEESQLISRLEQNVKETRTQWRELGAHCHDARYATNSVISDNYVKSNDALLASLSELLSKLATIQHRYRLELSTLTAVSKPPPNR